MKRVCALIVTALAGFVAIAIATGTRADSASTYRVDAIFDTAKGIIPGQVAKIAGARVGGIEDVVLTKDYKARIEMSIPRRFVFHKNASCNIQPEGLISENFVQCDPGTPGTPVLGGQGDSKTPTVPVQHTMVPVSITDLFRIFQANIRQRFTVAIAAVGGGLAARGSDLNDILRRSNPTLMAVRRLTSDLSGQTKQLNDAVRDTDKVIGALAQRKGAVQNFIVQSARVTEQTAAHRVQLADAIRRLPNLLDQTDTAIGNLVRLTRDGRPLIGQLRDATPGITRVVNDLSPFAKAGVPALTSLSHTADIAKPTIKAATPVVARLRTFGKAALPVGRTLNSLLLSLRDQGFVESLNLFTYYASAATARYDTISHILPAHALLTSCSNYATAPVAGCNAFYNGGSQTSARRARHRAHRHHRHQAAATGTPAATAGPQATPAVPNVLKPVQDLTQQLADTVKGKLPKNGQTLNDLADFLFRK